MKLSFLPARVFGTKAHGYEDLLLYAMYVGDGILLNSDGGLMKSWVIRGRDMESSSSSELLAQARRLNDVIRRLPEGWMLHIDSVRRPAVGYPLNSRFPDRTSWLIDEERRLDYDRTDAHYVSHEVLTATYLCPRDRAAKTWAFFQDRDERTPEAQARILLREATKEFEYGVSLIEGGFQEDLRPIPMVCRNVEHSTGVWRENPQLRHLIACATGVDVPVRDPSVKTSIRALVGSQHVRNGDRLRIGRNLVEVLSIEDAPNESIPGILDMLNQQPCSYRVSHRYIIMEKASAEKEIALVRRKHFQGRKGVAAQLSGGEETHIDIDALDMAEDATNAMSVLKSGSGVYGYWTMCVVFYEELRQGETEALASERLDGSMKIVRDAINKLGFITRVEETNTLEAFLGTLPGHGHANVRRSMLKSQNLVEFMPTTSLWTGEATCPSPMYPPGSPPLALVQTTGTMPFALNLHVGDVGHTMVTGPTGAGKSTLLAFLLAQHRRYPGARQICIDLGYSLFTLCKAVGGTHHVVSASGKPTFAPLEFIADPAERGWAESWIGLLLKEQGVVITSERREAIALALESLAYAKSRSLTDFTLQPFLDEEMRRAIRWYTVEREAGGLLDARTTNVPAGRMTVFEVEAIRDIGRAMMVPTLTYLFHLIERWLKESSPTLFTLDEVWSMLDDPQQAEQVKQWLKTLRKKNTAVVFATQSLEDLIDSPILPTLIQSCPTKIYLTNSEADSPVQRVAYEKFGLTAWQIKMISRATAKRDYYVTQPGGNRMISLDLQLPSLAFLGVSDPKEIARVQALIIQDEAEMQKAGTPTISWWPAKWLAARASKEWARHWILGPAYAQQAPIVSPPKREEKGIPHVA